MIEIKVDGPAVDVKIEGGADAVFNDCALAASSLYDVLNREFDQKTADGYLFMILRYAGRELPEEYEYEDAGDGIKAVRIDLSALEGVTDEADDEEADDGE